MSITHFNSAVCQSFFGVVTFVLVADELILVGRNVNRDLKKEAAIIVL